MTHQTKHDDSIHQTDGVDLAFDTKSNLFGEGGTTVVLEGPARGEVVATRNLTDCPDCGSELSDPVNIGWCLRCGYCRYLEEDAQQFDPLLELGLDPETQFCVDTLRALAKRLHGVKSNDPELMRSIDLVLALGQR